MSMLQHALDGVGLAGDVLDTPGAVTRTILSRLTGNENAHPLDAIFDREQRKSGRDLLEQWGAANPNKPGLDLGDVAAFVLENALDPVNLVGSGIVKSLAGKLGAARKSNTAVDAWNIAAHQTNLRKDLANSKAAEIARMSNDASEGLRRRRQFREFRSRHPERVFSFDRAPPWTDKFPYSDETKKALAYGSPLEVQRHADEIAPPLPDTPHFETKLTNDVVRAIESTGARAIQIKPSEYGYGFVVPQRPDLVFVSHDPSNPFGEMEIASHELIHSLASKNPDIYDRLVNRAGRNVVKDNSNQYFNYNDDAVLAFDRLFRHANKSSHAPHMEEGLAHLIGEAVSEAGVAPLELTSGHLSHLDHPRNFLETYLDAMSNGPGRRKSLVTTGNSPTGTAYSRSFARYPAAFSNPQTYRSPSQAYGVHMTVGDISDRARDYLPIKTRVQENLKELHGLLAYLAGHNAIVNYGRNRDSG